MTIALLEPNSEQSLDQHFDILVPSTCVELYLSTNLFILIGTNLPSFCQADGQLPGEREAEAGTVAHVLTGGEVPRAYPAPLPPGAHQDDPLTSGTFSL